jgi:hypothetical protein
MGVKHFVGRDNEMKRIQDVLTGREATGCKLTVLSIEGSGASARHSFSATLSPRLT